MPVCWIVRLHLSLRPDAILRTGTYGVISSIVVIVIASFLALYRITPSQKKRTIHPEKSMPAVTRWGNRQYPTRAVATRWIASLRLQQQRERERVCRPDPQTAFRHPNPSNPNGIVIHTILSAGGRPSLDRPCAP